MLRKLSSFVFLLVGVLIGLGAFGHGHAAQKVHAAIDQFPIDPAISKTLYIVWYFVSGCMVVFGATIMWMWFRLRDGNAGSLFVAYLIGTLYVATGVGGMIYSHLGFFGAVFITLGALLLASSFVLRSENTPAT